jgi:lysophospholipase L1-like esterase
MLENHSDYPAYQQHNLRALYSDVQFVDVSHSGDTSGEALEHLQNTQLPDVDGDVLVSLTCGGNDFNDDITTMISATLTEAAAARLKDNYREIARILREKYEDPGLGHRVVFLMTIVHDPTAGTGEIPPGFEEGFCGTIQNVPDIAVQLALQNLDLYNQRMIEVIEELDGHLVDNHQLYFDHGMNAPGDERWMSDDCTHPNDQGHHQLRREEWFVLTNQRF